MRPLKVQAFILPQILTAVGFVSLPETETVAEEDGIVSICFLLVVGPLFLLDFDATLAFDFTVTLSTSNGAPVTFATNGTPIIPTTGKNTKQQLHQ